MTPLEKVTAFITRQTPDGVDLLLFRHPTSGIQIPAGTVEEGETPKIAVIREVSEETSLTSLTLQQQIGFRDELPPAGQVFITQPTRVYSRPDPASFDWAYFRRGLPVNVIKKRDGYAQVDYIEFDRFPDPQYVMYRILGWVPEGFLAETQRRYFFLLNCTAQTEEEWLVVADNHVFTLFWAPLTSLPQIVSPQDEWLEVLLQHNEGIKQQFSSLTTPNKE